MNYDSFKEMVIRNLKEYLPKKYDKWIVKVSTVEKINRKLDCISVVPSDDNEGGMYPIIYPEYHYEQYTRGKSFESILTEMAEIVQCDMSTRAFTMDFKKMIKDVVPSVINKKKNKMLLKSLVHSEFCDLAVTYRVAIDAGEAGIYGCAVTKEILEEMGITFEELERIALENFNRKFPLKLCKFGENGSLPSAYMICNSENFMGACGFLRKDLFKEIVEKSDEDLFIIPSSIHELIVMPKSIASPAAELKQLIKDVNRKMVSEEIWLSDNLYCYHKDTEEITIVE